jgi:maltose/moltooligosaccharide transporter
MEPFRALVADKLPNKQRSYGFVMQTLIIGIGTWVASNLPWMVNKLGFSDDQTPGIVPMYVKIAFAIGAMVFLLSILYTIFTTKEYPPDDYEVFRNNKKQSNFFKDFYTSCIEMPSTMFKSGIVQFFSWFAFFTMWSMATPALTDHVYHSPAALSKNYNLKDSKQIEVFNTLNVKYNVAADKVGSSVGVYGLSSMAFALLLTFYTSRYKINRRNIHLVSLLLGGIGFLMMFYATPTTLKYCFLLIGISWGSILSMPYAMLSGSVNPAKMGMMMGLFNMFIVIPQIIAALGGITLLYKLFGQETIFAMTLAGLSMVLGSFSTLLITDKHAITDHE